MSGHTRGPWSVSIGKEHGDFGTIVGYCVEGVKSADNRWVVRFDDDYGTDQGSDARLIAAAPDYDEAAREMLDALCSLPEGCFYDLPMPLQEKLTTGWVKLERAAEKAGN